MNFPRLLLLLIAVSSVLAQAVPDLRARMLFQVEGKPVELSGSLNYYHTVSPEVQKACLKRSAGGGVALACCSLLVGAPPWYALAILGGGTALGYWSQIRQVPDFVRTALPFQYGASGYEPATPGGANYFLVGDEPNALVENRVIASVRRLFLATPEEGAPAPLLLLTGRLARVQVQGMEIDMAYLSSGRLIAADQEPNLRLTSYALEGVSLSDLPK